MSHRLRYAARSDRGLVRSNNQDSAYAGDRLLIVADGMGGHAAGDLASRVVVASFTDLDSDSPGEDLTGPLALAVRSGNDAISELVADDPELDGMGTTVTAMLFDGDRMALAHIGDSRAYLYRDGVLHQLSHDDTFVQSLVDEGRITEEEAAHHPQRNLLLRALNGSDAEPMLLLRQIHVGDRYMLCSDGLSSVVTAESIADALADPDPDTAADRLIELALVAGGPDNVTVIVADVLEVGARSTSPTGVYDPDQTGPMKPLHETQRMPRVPLPVKDDDLGDLATGGTGPDGDGMVGGGRSDEDDDEADATETDVAAAEVRRRRRFRWWVSVAAVVALVAGIVGLTAWAKQQFYVGVDSAGRVAIFRGLNGSLLGMDFSSIEETSCANDPAAPIGSPCTAIYAEDLQQSAKDLVTPGIEVADLPSAQNLIRQLASMMLPVCDPTAGTGTEGSTGSTGSSEPSGSSDAPASSSTSTGSRSSERTRTSHPNDRLRGAGGALTTVGPSASRTASEPESGLPTPDRSVLAQVQAIAQGILPANVRPGTAPQAHATDSGASGTVAGVPSSTPSDPTATDSTATGSTATDSTATGSAVTPQPITPPCRNRR